MHDAEEKRIERVEEEHITTADLAGTRSDDAEIVEERVERDPDRQSTAIPVHRSALGSSVSGAAAAPVQAKEKLATPVRQDDQNSGPLFSSSEAAQLREKWDAIQVGFVDEPRKSVEEADSLVATAMKRLAEQFAAERSKLEQQWDRGSDISTEDLRVALRRYRSFFGRLLNV